MKKTDFTKMEKGFKHFANELYENEVITGASKDGNRSITIKWEIVEFTNDYKGETQKGLYIDAKHTNAKVKGETLGSPYSVIKNALRKAVYNNIYENNGVLCELMFKPYTDKNGTERKRRQYAFNISNNANETHSKEYIQALKEILKSVCEILNKDFNTINELQVLEYEYLKDEYNKEQKGKPIDKKKKSFSYTVDLARYRLVNEFYNEYKANIKATDIQKKTTDKKQPKQTQQIIKSKKVAF